MRTVTKKITLGDRIFARVTKNGSTILDIMTEQVSTIGELIMLLKSRLTDIQGLVMIHIRNYHEGWGEEKALLLRAVA